MPNVNEKHAICKADGPALITKIHTTAGSATSSISINHVFLANRSSMKSLDVTFAEFRLYAIAPISYKWDVQFYRCTTFICVITYYIY